MQQAAFCRWDTLASVREELRVTTPDGVDFALVGSLDVCATRAVEGQVLIGECQLRNHAIPHLLPPLLFPTHFVTHFSCTI